MHEIGQTVYVTAPIYTLNNIQILKLTVLSTCKNFLTLTDGTPGSKYHFHVDSCYSSKEEAVAVFKKNIEHFKNHVLQLEKKILEKMEELS